MGRRLRRLLTSIALAKILGHGAPLLGYPTPVDYSGALTRWDINPQNPTIPFEIVGTDYDIGLYTDAIQSAAILWNDVPMSYFRYQEAASGETAKVTVHLDSALSGIEDAAGYTEFDQYDGTKPVHCSIHVLVDDGVSYYDTSKTFLHEFGHGLGLGHSLVPHAIMSYSLDKNKFALDTDDEAAVSRLYPADGSTPRLPLGCAVGAPAEGSRAALWLLLALPVAAGVALPRGRRCQTFF